ncbi:hypothetical protein CEUSTIGMA_g12470.t1 [Chlamydomonas eustigma]|uniref:DUF1279 domain-containing protein n=1 Tax=Chlamydomonas eustigma TaxID=1157962 RepID=A0A250XQH5_9CHLO|nr:hypothetical protein CEUSTIGMA_g12470.t1 [Chlamydomonas eustigma]|eukprot:GAX85050.1 hypothetical protein CEUSTIGMA_g12470.t1 [Chlamydomonas eustigma]
MAEPEDPKSKGSLFNIARLKEGLKKYGKTGLYVYVGLSFTVTTCFYIAIEQHLDVKKLLGMRDDPHKQTSWMESMLIGKGSNLALAMICSKACVPIKIPIAVGITPYVHRWKEQMFRGWALKSPRSP